MPVFGPNPGEPDPAQQMVEWIDGAPVAQLAAELMSAFDPHLADGVRPLAASDFSDWMFWGFPHVRWIQDNESR